jgi:hypothetical protein
MKKQSPARVSATISGNTKLLAGTAAVGGDSKQLFYRWQGQVWAVDVRTEGDFSFTNRHMLFNKPEYWRGMGGVIRDYDLDTKTQRFLMVKFDQRMPTPVTEMILVQNWSEELKRILPT